jgi:hypothetical protein
MDRAQGEHARTHWWHWLWAGPVFLVSGIAAVAAALAALAVAAAVVVGIFLAIFSGGGGEQSGFCAKHRCIDNFSTGQGSIIQCADGMWSHSGGLSGACSRHGGEDDSFGSGDYSAGGGF